MANTVINTPELLNLDSTTGATVLAKGTVNERPETPTFSLDYLVVAGGGGGIYSTSPGGGAGGLRTSYGSTSGGGGSAEPSLNVISGASFTVTVGNGGPKINASNVSNPSRGGNSVFGTITSLGGGIGISGNDSDGILWTNGGSGTGGRYGGLTGGQGTAGQGFAGGSINGAPDYKAGGSGGAGGVGVDATGSAYSGGSGAGGPGLAVNILNTTNAATASVGQVSGSDVYYAGGGGGGSDSYRSRPAGAGGIGGGGAGGYYSNGTSATANTGGGGGGGANRPNTMEGGDGGSGVIILRYPNSVSATVNGATQASGSPFTEGNDKITVLTSGTGTITFTDSTPTNPDEYPINGTLRFNTETNKTEYFDGTGWYEIVDEYASGFIGPGTNYFDTKLYTGNGVTQSIGGYINGSGSFNGSSSRITLPIGSPFNDSNTIKAVSAWIKAGTSTSRVYPLSISSTSNANDYWYIGYMGDLNAIYIATRDGSSSNQSIAYATITPDTGWHHIVVQLTATGKEIYLDGISQTVINSNSGTATNTSWISYPSYSGTVQGAIGVLRLASISYGQGSIDQVRVYDTVLSSADVTALYGETAATASTAAFPSGQTAIATYTMDTSANGLLNTQDLSTVDYPSGAGCIALYEMNGNSNDTNNTYNGTPTNITYQGGAFDEAAVFNGSSSKIVANSPIITTGAFSVSFWVNVNNFSTSYSAGLVTNSSNSGSVGFSTHINYISKKVSFFFGGGSVIVNSNSALTENTWVHIVCTYDGTNLKMYVDNALQTSTATGTMTSASNNLHIGTESAVTSRVLDGSIDQVRIFNQALTQAQVTTLARGIATSYSGANTNVNFNGHLDFQPDLVWTKCRSDAYDHNWVDSVRGINPNGTLYALSSNLTGAQTDSTNNVLSLDANGFTVQGTGSRTNAIGRDYVSWAWKAGGTAVSNTAGTITSQVSANKDSGFSIVKYTGNDVNGQSIGHGLSTSPELIIIKCLNVPEDWMVYTLPTGNAQKLYLNSSAAKAATGNMNNQTPTDDVFFVGGGTETGDLNDNYIAYCWHSVAGYSKIGTYEGLGATPVTVSGVGFKASFIIVKNIDATANWNMYDIKRSTVANRANKILYPNLSNSEPSQTIYYFEMNNDGFVVSPVNHEQLNYPNRTYIYMAIA